MSTPLLEVKDLEVAFRTQNGVVQALRGVSFSLERGSSLAIVGESGSGKSTTAHAIINLLPGTGFISGGQILLDGQDLTKASPHEMEAIRGRKIGFVPQDPMSNLNPVWSIGFQVEEAIRANGIATGKKAVKKRAIEVLKEAGLHDADRRLKQFPHQFSGGMRQRVLIGMGLAAERAEQLLVMYKGQVVEAGPSVEILQNPQHPYTQRLVAACTGCLLYTSPSPRD